MQCLVLLPKSHKIGFRFDLVNFPHEAHRIPSPALTGVATTTQRKELGHCIRMRRARYLRAYIHKHIHTYIHTVKDLMGAVSEYTLLLADVLKDFGPSISRFIISRCCRPATCHTYIHTYIHTNRKHNKIKYNIHK